MNIINEVAIALNISEHQVKVVLDLLAEKNTIPFIARYRKEATKGLDENQIFEINKYYEYQVNLHKRKEDVLRLIEEKGMLNENITKLINQATKIVEVDNIYQPYKEKKKTKANIAVELGLEPLAMQIMKIPNLDIEKEANKYLNDEVKTTKEAIDYALDIVAQTTCEHIKVRGFIQQNIEKFGVVKATVKKKHDDEQETFKMYYDFEERLNKIANHRILGLNRAVNQKVVTMNIEVDELKNIENIYRYFCNKQEFINKEYILKGIKDGYKRLLYPSLVRQIWGVKIEEAASNAIEVFALNLEKLLMAAPLKNKVILGFDPAYRTGCKLAVIDKDGSLLDIGLCFPIDSQLKLQQAKEVVLGLISKHNVEIIAIGNGTASRESEQFIAQLIKDNNLDNVFYAIVSEAGASVYSASKIAQKEFKDLKVEQRSAVSIARRLLDPLGELIKIDPKSIGVGQYQHDVNQKELSTKLDFTVEKIVNEVGVDINTSSAYLLAHISGISVSIADEIVKYKAENNGFKSRKELLKVNKLGPKAYEQAAGFLKVMNSKEPLDSTIIHPESYKLTYLLLKTLTLDIKNINDEEFKETLKHIIPNQLTQQLACDEYTLKDIIKALLTPHQDIRDYLEKPQLKQDILSIEDLSNGMELEGVVRNVVDFGVFVDIGLKNDALLHLSKISNEFIKHPSEKLAINDIIKVKVLEVDLKRKNVALTMK